MREQNTKTTVPLDVVPERRTKRFPPRFRPVGRFCELRFRYLSSPTGSEGEISRPLDHMRQIPFIHSARLIDSTNFCIHLFQKTLSERTANGSCRTEIARPKGTVVSIFAKNTMSSSQLRRQQKPHRFAYLTMKNSIFARFARAVFIF